MLFDTWGPVPGSPWEPFHCVTLFAALERIAAPGPTAPAVAAKLEAGPHLAPLPADAWPDRPPWLMEGTLTVIDLDGPQSVALGARLVRAGAQPVCTFDNWPHQAGVQKPEEVLAQLLRHATTVAAARDALTPSSPPVWLCDRQRLVGGDPRPRQFDNRYFLDDTLLPGTGYLKKAGIGTIVVVQQTASTSMSRDLEAWLADRAADKMAVFVTHLQTEHLEAEPITPVRSHVPKVGLRSDAGGFGRLIPEPSSSGG